MTLFRASIVGASEDPVKCICGFRELRGGVTAFTVSSQRSASVPSRWDGAGTARLRRPAVRRRIPPRGWADLGRQLAIWFGFLLAYQLARGLAAGDPAAAFGNGRRLIAFEQEITGLIELSLQRAGISTPTLA